MCVQADLRKGSVGVLGIRCNGVLLPYCGVTCTVGVCVCVCVLGFVKKYLFVRSRLSIVGFSKTVAAQKNLLTAEL